MGAAATGVLVPVGVSSWKSTFLQRKFSKTWGKHCRWINSFCFFCSAGRVEPSPGSKLRFQPPGKFRCSAVFFDSLVYIQLSRSGWPWGLIVFVGIVLKRFGFFAEAWTWLLWDSCHVERLWFGAPSKGPGLSHFGRSSVGQIGYRFGWSKDRSRLESFLGLKPLKEAHERFSRLFNTSKMTRCRCSADMLRPSERKNHSLPMESLSIASGVLISTPHMIMWQSRTTNPAEMCLKMLACCTRHTSAALSLMSVMWVWPCLFKNDFTYLPDSASPEFVLLWPHCELI